MGFKIESVKIATMLVPSQSLGSLVTFWFKRVRTDFHQNRLRFNVGEDLESRLSLLSVFSLPHKSPNFETL